MSQTLRTPSFYFKRVIGIILLLALAAVFFYSGYGKVHSQDAFDTFVLTFPDLGTNSAVFVGVMARVFIGFEFMAGALLVGHVFLRQFTYPFVIALLSLFTLYLVIVIIQQGNSGDCGCFGDKISMTPLQAIIKNIIMIAATLLLRKIYTITPHKNSEWIAPVVGMAALVTMFILFPIGGEDVPDNMHQTLPLDLLYSASQTPPVELRKGKHIIAFMSITCPHCRKAAGLLQIIHRNHPDIPMYIVLAGAPQLEKDFFTATHAEDIPHILYRNTEGFIQLAGPSVPAIYWVNNGIAEKKSNYYQLAPQYMEQWLRAN